jgi:hypothetical protein
VTLVAVPPEVYAALHLDPSSTKVSALRLSTSHTPFALVFPPTPCTRTAWPSTKECPTAVITIGEATMGS